MLTYLGVVYNIMDHEVVPYHRAFFNGHTFTIWFLRIAFWKSLGSWLGVNQMWIKISDHAPKNGCVVFYNICPKNDSFEHFLRVWPAPFFVPFSPYDIGNVWEEEKNDENLLKWHFYAMVPLRLYQEKILCLSHHQNRWTVTMDNVGMKIVLWGISCSMVTLYIFFLDVNQSGPKTRSMASHIL